MSMHDIEEQRLSDAVPGRGGGSGDDLRLLLLENEGAEAEQRVATPLNLLVPGRPRQRRGLLPKACTMAADVAAAVGAMTVAFSLRVLIDVGEVTPAARSRHLLLGALSLPLWIMAFRRYRLYSARHVSSRLEEVGRIVHAVAAAVLMLAGVAYILRIDVARGWLAFTFVAGVVIVTAEREVMRRTFRRLRGRGRMLRRVIVVGANAEGRGVCTTLMGDQALGYQVLGFVDDSTFPGARPAAGPPVLGRLDETLEIVDRTGATGVVIATSAIDTGVCNRLTRQLVDRGIHVELSASLQDIASERLSVRTLGRHPVVYVQPVRRGGWRAVAKRGLDIGLSATILAATLPLLIAAAVGIAISSKGPVLFRQTRVGRNGEPFEILKLRSMVAGAEHWVGDLRAHNEADGPLFKIKGDPRVTPIGRILRRFSIDELPQMWNVLRGQMSLVGPRPALPEELHGWSTELHQRLRVKPGVTGTWQVSGRSDSSFEDYSRLDLYYVDNWSLWTDLALVAKTVPALVRSRGAY